jgi:hypothetical protein
MLHKTYSLLVVLAFITLATAQLCVFNVGSCLRIRDSDNLAVSRVLGCVPDGTRLNDLGRSSNRDGINWRNVGWNGQAGWASGEFLRQCGTAPPPSNNDRPVFDRLPFQGSFGISQFYGDTRFARSAQRTFYGSTQGMHNGIDWATPVGTPLVAVCNGQIVHAGLNSPFAAGPRSVILRCGAWYVLYGHVDSESVRAGDTVTSGRVIARSGWPGNAHVHFEVRPVPARVVNNNDFRAHPVNPGTTTNPRPFFASSLDSHFNTELNRQGGASHFCTGNMMNQPDITFGGPLRTTPCTN